MKRVKNLQSLKALALTVCLLLFGIPAAAQRGTTDSRTDSRIAYHGGPVMTGSTNVYLIWYGNFPTSRGGTQVIMTDFVSFLGSSPYFQINTGYTDSTGASPSGALLFGGSAADLYSHGTSLTVSDIQNIVADQVTAQTLPLDTSGIYLVLAAVDVTDIRPDGSGYCTPGASPQHGLAPVNGVPLKYAFIGHPMRCPTSAAPQFIDSNGNLLPTANNDFAADAMVSMVAHALSALVTNPSGTAWFDRYGFENAAKCQGTFGATYSAPNGASANLLLGNRHYLLQQNWVNDRKGHCGLSNQ